MSLNIQKLKVTLNTNIPTHQSIEFTKDVLYHPEFNSFTGIEKYPYFTNKQLYPESYLSQLHYDEIVNIFFNRTKFERMLIENKPQSVNMDTDYISKTNVMTMLQLLFSTKYFIVNNIHQSLDIITHNESNHSLFYNPFNTQFSYVKINGNPYTVTKTVWLNDTVNHPKYNELMKAVRALEDDYIEKEYPPASIIKEKQHPFDVPVKFGDLSYRLRSDILPKYRHPYRESSNKELQKYIIGTRTQPANEKNITSEDVTKFYELFDMIYERYMLNNKDVKVDEKLLDVGIDNINIGYSDSYPKKEIFVLLDLIEGEVSDDNKKEVYCPYTNDYLGNLLNNLVYKEQSIKVLDKPRSMYSITENKSKPVDNIKSSTTNNVMQPTEKDNNTNTNTNESPFYTKIFNRTEKENKDLLNKIDPVILQSKDVFSFIKDNNNELYAVIDKSVSASSKTTNFMNQIQRLNSRYQTEIKILNDYLTTQSNILPGKIKETQNDILKYELYSHVLDNIKTYEDTKPLAIGGKKTRKSKKKVFNNTKKNVK